MKPDNAHIVLSPKTTLDEIEEYDLSDTVDNFEEDTAIKVEIGRSFRHRRPKSIPESFVSKPSLSPLKLNQKTGTTDTIHNRTKSGEVKSTNSESMLKPGDLVNSHTWTPRGDRYTSPLPETSEFFAVDRNFGSGRYRGLTSQISSPNLGSPDIMDEITGDIYSKDQTSRSLKNVFNRTRSMISIDRVQPSGQRGGVNILRGRKRPSARNRILSISQFKERISDYDKANWEKAVESHTPMLISMKQRKPNKEYKGTKRNGDKERVNFIDIDLVRGSTFSKAKPSGGSQRLNQGFFRVLFFPLFREWWALDISTIEFFAAALFYCAHCASLITYLDNPDAFADLTIVEVAFPLVVLVLLSIMYASVAATKFEKMSEVPRTAPVGKWAGIGGGGLSSESDDDDDDDEEEHQVNDQAEIFRDQLGMNVKVNAMLYDDDDEPHKLEMNLGQIGQMILNKVDVVPENKRFLYVGTSLALLSALLPIMKRLYDSGNMFLVLDGVADWRQVLTSAFGDSFVSWLIVLSSALGTFLCGFCVVFALAVAEHTYFQRFLYAKYFSALTSARRGRRYGLPHFRLHKITNIKMWLSLRSFLKRKGPQRSVDTIVSLSFILVLFLVGMISIKSTTGHAGLLLTVSDWQTVVWAFMLSVYLLRFMTLGSHINKKFQSQSLLTTEQINVYLRLEQAPHKKEELGICNNVLNKISSLLKDLESPYKISGMSMSPMLYNITRVVVLSAFSTVLSEVFGFKLKIWKIGKK